MLTGTVDQDDDDRLAYHVPWDFFVSREAGIFRNKDGSLTRCMSLRGRDLDSVEDVEMQAAVGNTSAAISQFGTGWCHHIEVQRRKTGGHPVPTADNPLARKVDEERYREFNRGHLMTSRCFASLTMQPPPETIRKLERFFTKRHLTERAFDAVRDLIEPFAQTTEVFASVLSQAMGSVRLLDADEALTYLHSCLSPVVHDVAAPDPDYAMWPIEASIMDTDFVAGSLPRMIDHKADWHLRTIGILGYPEVSYPGILESLDRLNVEYRFVQRFICLSPSDAGEVMRAIWEKRNDNKVTWKEYLWSRFEGGPPEADAIEVRHALEAQAAREDTEFGGLSTGWLTPTVTVWDRDLQDLQKKLDLVEEALHGRRFACRTQTASAWPAWQSSLPGETRAYVRKQPLPAIHPIHMFPMSQPWMGPERNERIGGPPLMQLVTPGGEIFRMDTHWGDTGHVLLVGPVRTGKSTLLATAAVQFHRYEGAQIYSFDVDATYSAIAPACRLCGGEVMSFAKGDLALQPFADIGEDEEEFDDWRNWCILTAEEQGVLEKTRLTPADVSAAIGAAMEMVAGEPRRRRTMDTFHAALQLPELKAAFADYCGDGPLAPMVNASEDRLGTASWVTFELTALIDKPKAVGPILLALMHKVWRRLNGRPTMIQFDEAWLAIVKLPDKINAWVRRLPKRNAFVIFAVHSLSDIKESRIAHVLRENCKSRWMLANPEAESEAGAEILHYFGYNEQQRRLIARATPKRDVFVSRPDGSRMAELHLGPRARAVCAAGGEADAKLLDRLEAEHGRAALTDAWLRVKGQHGLADELLREGGTRSSLSDHLNGEMERHVDLAA